MRLRNIGIFLLVPILLFPSVYAWHLSSIPNPDSDDEWDIRYRILDTNARSFDVPVAGNLITRTFPWDPEYTYTPVSHLIRAHVTYTAGFSLTTAGTWNITIAKENTGFLQNCYFYVETVNPVGITLDGLPVYVHYSLDCLFTQSQLGHPHNHTIFINRTALSGVPGEPFVESVSYRLDTEDRIIQTGIAEHAHLDSHIHNGTVNETQVRTIVLQAMNPIADELAIIAWIILVGVTYWTGQKERGRGISMLLAAAVIFLGLMVLPDGPLYFLVSIGVGAFLLIRVFGNQEEETKKGG